MKKPITKNLFSIGIYIFIHGMFCFIVAKEQKLVYKNDPENYLKNKKLTMAVLPFLDVKDRYFFNGEPVEDSSVVDSFFIESANKLLQFETSKLFTSCSSDYQLQNDAALLILHTKQPFSYLYNKKENIASDSHAVSTSIQRAAACTHADLVLVPISCDVWYSAIQNKGWRDAPHYQQPIKYVARTTVHVQIWHKDGTLIYEKIARHQIRQPIFYSILKREAPKRNESIVTFAKKRFAPPLIRSISISITKALHFR